MVTKKTMTEIERTNSAVTELVAENVPVARSQRGGNGNGIKAQIKRAVDRADFPEGRIRIPADWNEKTLGGVIQRLKQEGYTLGIAHTGIGEDRVTYVNIYDHPVIEDGNVKHRDGKVVTYKHPEGYI